MNVRVILKTIGLLALLTGLLSITYGGHRLVVGVIDGHRYTLAQYVLFVVMVTGGLLGCVSGVLLVRLHGWSRHVGVLYLMLIAASLFLADTSAIGIAQLVLVGAAVVCLLTPAARAVLENSPRPTSITPAEGA